MHMEICTRETDTRAGLARGWWHELNCRDTHKAVQFYGKVLGWRFDEVRLADGSIYRLAIINGHPACGLFEIVPERHGDVPDHWMTYAHVGDIDVALRAVHFAGGEVVRAPVMVPGLGRLALISDAAGAIIGLYESQTPTVQQRNHAHDEALRPMLQD